MRYPHGLAGPFDLGYRAGHHMDRMVPMLQCFRSLQIYLLVTYRVMKKSATIGIKEVKLEIMTD